VRTIRSRQVPIVLAAGLVGLTLVALALPDSRFGAVAPGDDVVVNETTALIALAIAWMSWFRYAELADGRWLLGGSAFLLLGSTSLALMLAGLSPAARSLGLTLAAPGQAPLYLLVASRGLAAVLLVAAGGSPRTGPATHRGAVAMFLAPSAITLVLALALWLAEPALPRLIGPDGVAALASGVELPRVLPGRTPLALVLHGTVAILFAVGALRAAASTRSGGHASSRFVAAGLTVLGVAELHAIVYPGVFAGLLTSGDLLRVGAYLSLFAGLHVDARATSVRLRQAHRAMERLREADAARAALDVRRLLAREIHDGLAQNLWLAKLRLEDVSRAATLDEARVAADAVGRIVDEGIHDARRSLQMLRSEAEPEVPLAEAIERQAATFSRESGLPVELDASRDLAELPPRAAAALLRIVSEALSNVAKHADATVVRLEARSDDQSVRVRVVDNGVGFETGRSHPDGVGLLGMAERATLVGGHVRVESALHRGTSVAVDLPVAAR
jgi:signal transduction histidine kinase